MRASKLPASPRGSDFPVLIRRLRQVRGLTQEQLAREIGVTFSTVNCWENGKHVPMPALGRRLIEMAAAAGVTMQRLGEQRMRRMRSQ